MTVTDVITQFRYKYPACSAARALVLFNDVYREFASRSQLRNKREDVALTAGEKEYDMPDGIYMIHESYYMPEESPTTWFPLTDVSTDKLIELSKGWRITADTESQPVYIYTTTAVDGNTSKGRVGFYTAPSATTGISGYPAVSLFVTSIVDLEADDDLPALIINSRVFIYGMYKYWSAEMAPQDYPMNTALADAEMDRNIQHVMGLQVHDEPEVINYALINASRVR